MPSATTPPDPTAGRRLLLALMGAVRRLRSRPVDGAVDPASLWVLYRIAESAPVRPTELAKGLCLDPSTVSRHVARLEAAGYLERTDDPDDRRATRVLVTAQGQAFMDEAMRRRIAVLEEAIADWPADDLETLTKLMTRLAETLDRLAEERENG